jgi:hypothetical protein
MRLRGIKKFLAAGKMQNRNLFFGVIWKFCRGVTFGVSLDFSYEHGVRIFVKTSLEILFGYKNDDVTKRQVQKMK